MLIGVNMLSTVGAGGGGFAAPGATKNGLSSGSTCGSAAAAAAAAAERANLSGRNGPVDIDDDEDTSLALRLPRLLPDDDESGGPAGSAASSCVAGAGAGSGLAAGCCDAGAYARMASQISSSPNWE